MLQRKKLQALYDDKVKGLVEELLYCDGELERWVKLVVCLNPFVWLD